MARKDYYTIKRWSPTQWRVMKVSDDWEPQGEYIVSDINDHLECGCFASNKSTCRHRDMIRMYKISADFQEKMDNGAKYNFDKDAWLMPAKGDQ